MHKESISYNKTMEVNTKDKLMDFHSSKSEASDTEGLNKTYDFNANNSNISRSSLATKSIDLNDDDDADEE